MAGYHERVLPPIKLGFNAKEQREYSIVEGLRNILLNAEGKPAPKCMAFDVHQSLERLTGRSSSGLLVPVLDLHWQRSPLQAGVSSLGGSTVSNTVLPDWIEALRNRLVCVKAGAKLITDLVGNVNFPRQNGVGNAYWVKEGEAIPESNLMVDLVELKPRDVAAIVPTTRRLMLQSSVDIESLIRQDLIQICATALDKAALLGAGGDEPLGIMNTPGVTRLEIANNGGSLDWSKIVAMETEISSKNADGMNSCYIANAKTRGFLKRTQKVAGQAIMLWEDEPDPVDPYSRRGVVNGYVAHCSNQLPSDGIKGTGSGLSTFLFGDFSQLMIGNWGVIEILPNPYGAGFPSGAVQLRVMLTADAAVRHPESFCYYSDVTTV